VGPGLSFAYRGGDGELHLGTVDGGDRQLTHAAAFPARTRITWFSWSPDGSRLVFWRTSATNEPHELIYVVDADGSHLRRIGGGSWPVWSPNGKQMPMSAGGARGCSSSISTAPTDTGSVLPRGLL
jgi:Tol biopolymer transport system component